MRRGPEIWTTPRDWLRITMIGDILEGREEWNAGQGWQGTRARSLLGKSVSRIVLLFHDWCEFRGTGFTLLTDINSFRRFTIRLKIAKPVPFDRWKLSNPVAETLKRRIFIREREFQIGSIEYELFRTKFCWWRGKNLTLIVYLSKFVIIIIANNVRKWREMRIQISRQAIAW